MSETNSEENTAHHEAGHAVAAWRFGFPTKRVSVIPEEDFLGVHEGDSPLSGMDPDADSSPEVTEAVEKKVVLIYAGHAAQVRFEPDSAEHYSHSDASAVLNLVGYLCGSIEQEEAKHAELYARAETLIHEHWGGVEAVAKVLLEHKELTGEEVARLLEALTGEAVLRSSLFDYTNTINDIPPDWPEDDPT